MDQLKSDLGVGKGHPLKFITYMPELNGIRLQEIATRWNIEEQISHRDLRPFCGDRQASFHDRTALDGQLTAHFLTLHPTFCFDLSHSGDRGQCLSTESARTNLEQIFGTSDLGSGVPFKGQSEVCSIHSRSVVRNLDDASAGLLDPKPNFSSSRIHCILQ